MINEGQGGAPLDDDMKSLRKKSSRHVLVIEADMSEDEKRRIFNIADRLRLAGNELTALMRNSIIQLLRTKRYRKLKTLYGKASENGDNALKSHLSAQMKAMQIEYGVSWDFCRKAMIPIGKKFKLPSVFALTRAEDIWKGVEKVLYEEGKMIHFQRRGDLPILRAKQIERIITVKNINNHLILSCDGITFSPIIRDRFERDEADAVLDYLAHSEEVDEKAAKLFSETGKILDTYRPCYAALKCEEIRGRLRVFIHLTIEGKAMAKFNKDGSYRHKYGTGIIGCDIGTQTVAYTSDKECGLKNLAERGNAISRSERKERILLRRLDRSIREMNPQNFNDDGTVKKRCGKWTFSKNYVENRKKLSSLHRKNSINRHLAIREDVNHMRSLGDVFITEAKNAKKLMLRSKETAVNEKTGRTNRKKRFGKSVRNRCPGYFQSHVKDVFLLTGGKYFEVPYEYRASQYDHTNGEYVQKKLSDRMFSLSDGTIVQRDLYSSFLLYNATADNSTGQLVIDGMNCINSFASFNRMHEEEIERIRLSGRKVLNSGIRAREGERQNLK